MSAVAVFAQEAFQGGTVDNGHHGKLDYDLFIRARGTGGWTYGVTAHNPSAAMFLQSNIRFQRPYIDVKVLNKPKGEVHDG